MGTSFSSVNGANGSGYSTGTGIATTGGTGTGCTVDIHTCLLYTSPSPRDRGGYRMPASA